MNTVSISPLLAHQLYSAASFMSEQLACIPVPDARQAEMDLGTDQALDAAMAERETLTQAIDEFMAEREDLKARIAFYRGQAEQALAAVRPLLVERQSLIGANGQLGLAVQSINEEAEAAFQACRQAADWVDIVRTKLESLGITIRTDEAGIPQLTINIDELSAQAVAIQDAIALAV